MLFLSASLFSPSLWFSARITSRYIAAPCLSVPLVVLRFSHFIPAIMPVSMLVPPSHNVNGGGDHHRES
jgi:hypothetical protein